MHKPVLLDSVLSFLDHGFGLLNKTPKIIVDATFGFGGYSQAILKAYPECKVLAIDQDPISIDRAKALAPKYQNRLIPVQERFSNLKKIALERGYTLVDAILFDIGVSSMQLDNPARGFSFKNDGPLDMRMSSRGELDYNSPQITAFDVVNNYSVERLTEIFYRYGEERLAKKIANAIERKRTRKEIETTKELADLIARTVGFHGQSVHPATKIFQALRIHINDEFRELYRGLVSSSDLLERGGICMVVSFHSLEDRLAKKFFRGQIRNESEIETEIQPTPMKYHSLRKQAFQLELLQEREIFKGKDINDNVHDPYAGLDIKFGMLSNRVVKPSDEEIKVNPRSRSAKLRPMMKL